LAVQQDELPKAGKLIKKRGKSGESNKTPWYFEHFS
jgi:hypothetical protein